MTGYGRDLGQDVKIASGGVAELNGNWIILRYIGRVPGCDKHNLVDNVIFSPRINTLWKPSDKFQGRLTWSTGFRAPQAYDE